MSRLVVPFDFNPATTEVKEGVFTVPSGKYCFIESIYPGLIINGFQNDIQNLVAAEISFPAGTSFHSLPAKGLSTLLGRDISTVTTGIVSYSFLDADIDFENNVADILELGLAGTKFLTDPLVLQTNNSQTIPFSFDPILNFSALAFGLKLRIVAANPGTTTVRLDNITTNHNGIWVGSGSLIEGKRYRVTTYNQVS